MDFYLFLIILLFVLAASDLVVGVSNDAVNFLNSAIGSKVASRQVILVVASLGIITGAMFSSGMMEVARKGIFNPELFSFSEVMIIFLAVMLTDIVLLDFFNTFGMPTSTTVSIVFELLGASVIMSIIKITGGGGGIDEIISYINTSKAIQIILGIFISVGIAFTVGAVVQFISRLIFSFNYERRIERIGPIWGGLALAVLSYFLIGKGLNGSDFLSEESVIWIQSNTILIILGATAFWALVFIFILRYTKINVLRVIVFAGTFSLAMAFANNDLVNFIGVPIAGFSSFLDWRESGASPDSYMMTALSEQVPTPTYLLMIAGAIMVVTLWKSKKAQTVTATEVNLSSQVSTTEKFKAHLLAELTVKTFLVIYSTIRALVPQKIRDQIRANFQKTESLKEEDAPAFDLVRASVNLTTASLLIAVATSMKLPLSTTYVSFMVAMGTSLADRAWGSKSAVYRVSGVINVIGGWFMTALIAFSVSGLIAFLIWTFGLPGIIVLVAVIAFLIINSMRMHRNREKRDEERKKKSRN